MANSDLEVVVIGAGHAGLSISYHLKRLKMVHLVFEKGQIGNSWRTQRWDSFRLNTANNINLLPGQDQELSDPEGFSSASEYAGILARYSGTFQLPVSENSEVLSVEKLNDSNLFSLIVNEKGTINRFRSKQVVVASGGQNKKLIPVFSEYIMDGIIQIHASEFRNASMLPAGSVLVVGSAQSGLQIAEDLADNGRKVFISTSKVGRIPRRYRGKDIVDWLNLTGFMDIQTKEITDPLIFSTRQPQVSGTGLRGHTVSLQSLEKKGAVILGKIRSAGKFDVILEPDAAMNILFADNFSKKVKRMIDDFIDKNRMDSTPPEIDIDDIPDESASCASSVTSLNLIEKDIKTIIWSTGFCGDFSYLKFPVLDSTGGIKHICGVSDIEGLFFLGLPWLRKRKSGIILGIREDSEYIFEKIVANRKAN